MIEHILKFLQEGLIHKNREDASITLPMALLFLEEHSMGTAILLHCHVVGVDTVAVLLVLRESWGRKGRRLKDRRIRRD